MLARPSRGLGWPYPHGGIGAVAARAALARLFVAAMAVCALVGCDQSQPKGLVDVDLTAVGGPVDALGAIAVAEVKVEVLDAAGRTVRFDEALAADPNGPLARVTLRADEPLVTVYLPPGASYRFAAKGYTDAGELVAYGEARHVATGRGGGAVAVDLAGLLGEARLVRRTPVHALLPGQTLDALLTVAPPRRPDLEVLPRDLEADYEVVNGEVIESSGRGVRLRAGTRAGDVVAQVEVSGLVPAGTGVGPGSVTAELRVPFATAATVDLTPPWVSSLAFDPDGGVLTGVADDDLGVTSLEVYDGPVLLATSDPEAAQAADVPQVVFPGGGTSFVAPLELPSGTYELTVYATDFSGNLGAATHAVTVP